MISIVYMVAGISSRFNGNVKQMAKIGPNDETLIEYSVNQALLQPFSELVFITNEKTEYLYKNIFNDIYIDTPVKYIKQTSTREKPWGTSDAVSTLHNVIFNPFILVNGDDIYGEDTFRIGYKHILEYEYIIGGILLDKTITNDDHIVNRGIIELDEHNNVTNLTEFLNISKQTHPHLMNSVSNVNFIGMSHKILPELKNMVSLFKKKYNDDKNIECLLPNDLNYIIRNRKISMKYFEIPNKIIGVTYPGDDILVKHLINSDNFG